MKLKIFCLTLICLSFSQSAYTQKILILDDEFYSVVRRAEAKVSNTFPQKHFIKETFYENGRIIKTVDILWEAVSSDDSRIVTTETSEGNVKKYEEITIDLKVYKRENNGEWKKEESRFRHGLVDRYEQFLYCAELSKELSGENQNIVNYRYFQIGKDRGGLNYEENSYLIDQSKNGLLLKKEVFRGQLNPRNVKWHQIFTYDYDSNIKIEAPIK